MMIDRRFRSQFEGVHRLAILLVGSLLLSGCNNSTSNLKKAKVDPKKSNSANATDAKEEETQGLRTETLKMVLRDIPKMILMERRVATLETTRNLNSWGMKPPTTDTWQQPAVIETLPEPITELKYSKQLPVLHFEEAHSEYIFQCRMFRNVHDWVVELPYRDGLFAPWVEEQKAKLGRDEHQKFVNTLKLFDWSIRNVWNEGSAKANTTLPLNPDLSKQDQGIGYTRMPWHSLMIARGDIFNRGRVFSQLAFQEGVPVGWFCFPGLIPEEYKIWILGIPIGDEIYLLDPRLGIPLPGPNQVGIATWNDAKNDPTVLRRAKVGDLDYPVTQADLNKAFFVMDVEPFAMSHGMNLLEQELTGDDRLKLSCDADGWQKEFQKRDGKLQVKLWSLPWYGLIYGVELRERLKNFDQFTANFFANMGTFLDDTPVSRARIKHFDGKFENEDENETVQVAYMNLRLDEETIGKLAFDINLQKQMMIKRIPNEADESFKVRIRFYQNLYRQAKVESNMFLSMMHFDLGNFPSSVSFADRWMLKVKGTEYWHPMCWYLIGRSLEQQGKTAEAIEMYKKSPSSQEAGNRIRARLLGRESTP